MLIFLAFITTHLAFAADFTYEDLVNLSKDKSSVEEVLPLLPESFRSNYTLMHSSRSLQGSSYENPRAILFGENAKLICSFNGDPSHRGYDSLECIQFRDKERNFDFRHIQFPTPENKLKKVAFSESGKTTDGTISCSMCHTADPRPNWDEYPEWPGAYGSADDDVTIEKEQEEQYAIFVKNRDLHPRYRWLIQATYPHAPYQSAAPKNEIKERPNLRFSEFLGKWNALRLKQIFRSKLPEWRVLAFAMGTINIPGYNECLLDAEQQAILTKDGIDFSKISSLTNILEDVGLNPEEASTQTSRPLRTPPDHQSGFTFLSNNVGMSVVQDLADNGNPKLRTIIDEVKSESTGTSLDSFQQRLNAIFVHLYPFQDGIKKNFQDYQGYFQQLCPELKTSFMKKYLESKGE